MVEQMELTMAVRLETYWAVHSDKRQVDTMVEPRAEMLGE
jgi:hypothetical protein